MKHNIFRVSIGRATTRQAAKKTVALANLTSNQKFLLFYVLDQAAEYVLTVEQIRRELVWGSKKWVTVRNQLTELGILEQTSIRLAEAAHQWTLAIDLAPLQFIPPLSKVKKERVTRAGAQATHLKRSDMNLNNTAPRAAPQVRRTG
jgi:hypothetical protein